MEQFPLKQTGDYQKDFYTSKAVRKFHMESGRKRRKVIMSGPLPLIGDTEEKGDDTGLEILPGE